jgi:hypothetical protein
MRTHFRRKANPWPTSFWTGEFIVKEGNWLAHSVQWPSYGLSSRSPGLDSKSFRICGEQRGTRTDFLFVLLFPLSIIPSTAPHSSSTITRGWYNRPNSGRRTEWTQSQATTWTGEELWSSAPISDLEFTLPQTYCALDWFPRKKRGPGLNLTTQFPISA